MFLSWFSGRFASKVAPWRAAPDEIPARTPSVAANSLAAVYASSVVTVDVYKRQVRCQLKAALHAYGEYVLERPFRAMEQL